MNDAPKLFLAGALAGWFIAVMLNSLPSSDASKYRAAIAECEKSLPRDQHCLVIGVKP
jgi:hypothetical protein